LLRRRRSACALLRCHGVTSDRTPNRARCAGPAYVLTPSSMKSVAARRGDRPRGRQPETFRPPPGPFKRLPRPEPIKRRAPERAEVKDCACAHPVDSFLSRSIRERARVIVSQNAKLR
jgi:hypothetical protein